MRYMVLKPADAAFKLRFYGETKMKPEDEKAINDDLFSFLDDVNKTDKALR